MLSIEVRNKRLLTASVRAARAEKVAQAAERAIQRRDAAQAEVEWLRTAPVKDGTAGQDLPSDADIKAYVEERVKPAEQDGDDTADNAAVSSSVSDHSLFSE